MRNFWVAALCAPFAMTGAGALAQESPELPAKSLISGQPATGPEMRFTKGKGPGRGNSYVARYEEDYAYLRDPTRSSDFFDPLKYIAIDPEDDVYLTLNGESRFRFDYADHRNFAVATAATPAKQPGGPAIFTAASGVSTYKQRYELGGDLHIGPISASSTTASRPATPSAPRFPAASATSSGW